MRETLTVAKVIDEHPIGWMQIRIFLICSVVAFFDGYDTQAIGYVAPLLAAHTKAPIASFGIAFSAGLAGAAIGAFLLGSLADRFGRRWLLLLACGLMSAFSFLTVYVSSFSELVALRFITGLGLGGAVPVSLALVSEYFPSKRRGLAMTAMFSAFPLGGVIGGLIASSLITRYGWPSVFLIGGILPGLACIAIVVWVPESLDFLAARGDGHRIRAVLSRIAPGAIGPALSLQPQESRPRNVARELFINGRLPITLLLWAAFFCGFMVILTVVLWGPALLSESGVPLSVAAIVFASHYLGGFIGTAGCGYLVDRFGPTKTLIPAFLLGGLCLTVLGHLTWSPVLLCIDAFLAGLLVVAGSNGLLPVAASLYPAHVRSTGIGWAMGTGRIGQLVGPVLVGLMLSGHKTSSTIFTAALIPCIVAAAIVWIASSMAGRIAVGTEKAGDALLERAET